MDLCRKWSWRIQLMANGVGGYSWDKVVGVNWMKSDVWSIGWSEMVEVLDGIDVVH